VIDEIADHGAAELAAPSGDDDFGHDAFLLLPPT